MVEERDGAGRVATVLAGTKGLGRGCVDALAARGFSVALCARTAADVEATVDQLRSKGVQATGRAVDVADPAQLEAFLGQVDVDLGPTSVLVANAGGPPPGRVLDLDDAAWQLGFELTFLSAVRSIRLAVPRMRRAGYGRIVVIGSSSVRQPLEGLALSNAYRPALVGVVKSLALDLAPEGITANLVAPGRIATERVAQLDALVAEREGVPVEEVRARSEQAIPMGAYGRPADLGELVGFLASPAAGYLTGQTILVDGGLIRSLH